MNATTSNTATQDRIAVSVKEAVRLTGLSRPTLYRHAARGRIVMLKAGRTTLVEMGSLRAFMAVLPVATIRVGLRGDRAATEQAAA